MRRLLAALAVLFVPLASAADAIHVAAGNGEIETVRRLLEEDPKRVNARQQDGSAPLLSSAIRGYPDIARLLLDHGADPNLGQYDGWTALHAAVHDGNDDGHVQVARLLIDRGANVEARRTADGWTPLLAAALVGSTKTMAVLLDRRASLTATDIKGSGPLHFAAYGGQPAAIRLLLERGADPSLKNKDGNTALNLAPGGTNPETVEALVVRKPLSLHFVSASVADALKRIAEPLGVPLLLDSAPTGEITLDIDGLGLFASLASVLRAAGSTHVAVMHIDGIHIVSRTGTGTPHPSPLVAVVPSRKYRFDRTISREVLNNYLSRSVTHFGLCSGWPEPSTAYFEDDLRMLTHIGAKHIGVAAYAWGGPADEEAHYKLARERADCVHQIDPEIMLQAVVFESVYKGHVEKIPVPPWVFDAFGLPVEQRSFRYGSMLYGKGKHYNMWGPDCSPPDMTKLETRLWFYYRSRRYIDAGFEEICFGQIDMMDEADIGHRDLADLLTRLRKYAAQHARRHMALFDANTHGMVVDGNRLLFDFHSWPLMTTEVKDSPEKARLVAGFYNSIYGRSMGGITPSGWSCDSLPYQAAIDCSPSSSKPGTAVGFPWIWGYDTGSWLTHQPEAYRREFLQYAWDWLRDRKEDAWLQMPTRLNLSILVDGQKMWHSNRRSAACPVGFGLEDTIRAIWHSDGPDRLPTAAASQPQGGPVLASIAAAGSGSSEAADPKIPPSAELMRNGSVEENDGKQAEGFDFSQFGVALDSTIAHTGRFSIRTSCDALHTSLFTTPLIPLSQPNDKPRRILVRAWIRARNLRIVHQGGWSAGQLMVWAHDAGGAKIKTLNPLGWDNVGLGEITGYFSGTFGWREFTGNLVVPPGTASVSIQGGIGWASGTAWFDDFSVTELPLAWEPAEDTSASVRVDLGTVSAKPIEGVGWNWSFVWDQPHEMGSSPAIVEQLLKFAEWDQQSFVRFGFLAQRCLRGDLRTAEPAYDSTKPGSIFYEHILSGLDRLGVHILATNWHYGDGQGPYQKPPYPADRFAAGVTEVLRHWIVRDRFRNVRWVSIWNEPDWWYKFGGNYPGDFPNYWSALDDRLRAVGLRDRVGIVAADTTQGGSIAEQAFPAMDARVGTAADAYSAHDYFSAVEAPGRTTSGGVLQPFLRGYAAAARSLDLGGKPLFIGEFGCQRTEEEMSYRGTLGAAELVIGGLNAGVRGFARWVYNCEDGIGPSTGFNPFALVNGKLEPKRAVYYGYAVITKAVPAGAKVAEVRVDGGKDAAGVQRVHAAILVAPGNRLAILIANDGLQPRKIKLSGISGRTLHHYWYDSSLPDGIQRGADSAGEALTLEVKPLSINAFTTWEWNSLKP